MKKAADTSTAQQTGGTHTGHTSETEVIWNTGR